MPIYYDNNNQSSGEICITTEFIVSSFTLFSRGNFNETSSFDCSIGSFIELYFEMVPYDHASDPKMRMKKRGKNTE